MGNKPELGENHKRSVGVFGYDQVSVPTPNILTPRASLRASCHYYLQRENKNV